MADDSKSSPKNPSSSSSGPDSSRDDKQKRDEDRRRRNVESAKRSRDRKNQEQRWMEIQVLENEDRIRDLEQQIENLTAELHGTPKEPLSPSPPELPGENRPEWFGEAF